MQENRPFPEFCNRHPALVKEGSGYGLPVRWSFPGTFLKILTLVGGEQSLKLAQDSITPVGRMIPYERATCISTIAA